VKDEVQRISKLVAEGRLSPEDAAVLIDAFYAGDRGPAEPSQERGEYANGNGGPPPPPPDSHPKDPFRSFVESIEKMTKEGIDSVNWQEVASQARHNARKGVEAVRSGIEDLSKGKMHFGWAFNQETKELTLPLSLAEGKILKVDNPCGSVKIVGGFDTGSVTARARFKAASLEEARAKASAYTLIVEESDHAVEIKQPDVSGLCVELEIQLAGTGSVEIKTETGDVKVLDTKGAARVSGRSGNVQLRGLIGAVEVSADSGNVDLEDILSPAVTVENKSGDVRASRVRGNISVRAASGSISVADGSSKILSLETVSGNVSLNVEEPVTGAFNVRTVSGSANVAVPDLSDCRVSLSTLRGSVASNLQLSDEARTDTRITGKLGQGSGTLDVSAVTGDIILEMRSATVSA
jgi:DUF4097 and DUF4098 domain-containing protein YvlB